MLYFKNFSIMDENSISLKTNHFPVNDKTRGKRADTSLFREAVQFTEFRQTRLHQPVNKIKLLW